MLAKLPRFSTDIEDSTPGQMVAPFSVIDL